LVNPLTHRELTVLRYLQGTLSNLEVAANLSVFVNTVKSHVRSVYRKLAVAGRREAVCKARDLNLL
jgi:LuxR family transcriptional regulator, maltose regulon positive regulatory protein